MAECCVNSQKLSCTDTAQPLGWPHAECRVNSWKLLCTGTAQPLGWPHAERQSSAGSSTSHTAGLKYYRKLPEVQWSPNQPSGRSTGSMALGLGIAGLVAHALSWQPQLPVKCLLGPSSKAHLQDVFQLPPGIPAVYCRQPLPRTMPGGDQARRTRLPATLQGQSVEPLAKLTSFSQKMSSSEHPG